MRTRFEALKHHHLKLLLCAALFAAAAGLVICFNMGRSPYLSAAASLTAELKAARAEHLLLTPDELRTTPPPPDSDNAALLYQQMNLSRVTGADEDALANVRKPHPSAADRRAAEVVIRKSGPALVLAAKAADLPGCDFHRNWSLGPDVQLPEYAVLRKVVRILAAKATMQIDAGLPREALRTIRIGAKIEKHLGREPILIPFLVRIALEAIMDQPMRRLMCRYADRPEILKAAEETNRAFDQELDIERALRGEVVMCRIMTNMIRTAPETDFSYYEPKLRMLLLSRRTVTDSYEARSISYWRRTFAALQSSQSDHMAQYYAMKAISIDEDARALTSSGNVRPTYELDAVICPYFYQCALKAAGTDARRRLRKTMFALFDYHHAHGRFPAKLADLTAAQLPDPLTGKPLGYRSDGKTFTLYSVGENLIDDGGSSKRPKKGDPPLDIVANSP